MLWLSLLGAVGCGHHRAAGAPGAVPSAKRIYQAAEAEAARGAYREAALLVGQAVLALPEDSSSDDLRHKLLMRMAHLQLVAARDFDDSAYAAGAAAMLANYGNKHVALFGDDPSALEARQRAEIFELLYAAEEEMERLEGGTAAEPRADDEIGSNPEARAVAEVEDSSDPVDTHAGEDLEPEMTRTVRVQKRGPLAQPDDPRVRARLESALSDAGGYFYMTSATNDEMNPTRPMVRMGGLARDADRKATPDARELGRAVLGAARVGLRRCFREAFARRATTLATATVEATVRPDGHVHKARVVEGGLIDGIGDACVMLVLRDVRVAPLDNHADAGATVLLPLRFFYARAHYTGAEQAVPLSPLYPGIDDFATPPN